MFNGYIVNKQYMFVTFSSIMANQYAAAEREYKRSQLFITS